jgi:hypothetical protein
MQQRRLLRRLRARWLRWPAVKPRTIDRLARRALRYGYYDMPGTPWFAMHEPEHKRPYYRRDEELFLRLAHLDRKAGQASMGSEPFMPRVCAVEDRLRAMIDAPAREP